MIGVAGVTFSITIASVVYASGQYGPRLLTNFMADRGNQVTLGTFIATFLYGLLVLRTIRAADEGPAAQRRGRVGPFVPHIAHRSSAFGARAREHRRADLLHPPRPGEHPRLERHRRHRRANSARAWRRSSPSASGDGGDGEARAARPQAAVPAGFYADATPVRRRRRLRPGRRRGRARRARGRARPPAPRPRPARRLRGRGDALVSRSRPSGSSDEVRSRAPRRLRVGQPADRPQDVRFLFNELVEIAARALSPGVNDPFTAISCLDWLGAALKRLAGRRVPGPNRFDDAGTLRVVAAPTTFPEFVGLVFGQLRPVPRRRPQRGPPRAGSRSERSLAGRARRRRRLDTLRRAPRGCRGALRSRPPAPRSSSRPISPPSRGQGRRGAAPVLARANVKRRAVLPDRLPCPSGPSSFRPPPRHPPPAGLRVVAQPGSAPSWGLGGRGFKSRLPDTMTRGLSCKRPRVSRCEKRVGRRSRPGHPAGLGHLARREDADRRRAQPASDT